MPVFPTRLPLGRLSETGGSTRSGPGAALPRGLLYTDEENGDSGAMAYTITFYKDDAEIDTILWGGSRESAIDHARNHFGTQSDQNGATAVVVRDDGGHVIIQHPPSNPGHPDVQRNTLKSSP